MEYKSDFAKFRISTTELEISGPVDFVSKQVQSNKNIVDFFAEKIKIGLQTNQVEASKSISFNVMDKNGTLLKANSEYADFEEVKESEGFLDKYSSVLAVNGDKIQILSDIPGNSKVAKMLNLILIYLYVKVKVFSVDRILFTELRQFCEMHGELDAGHFADYVKKNKKWFLIDGSGKNTNAKITVPGMKEAERLTSSMNN